MSTIKKFEDIIAWQKARELSKQIFLITKLEAFSKDFNLKNQIRSSSGSIMDNIAEGFERNGNKEFKQFLSIAKGSCGEVKSQLYRAIDQKYIEEEQFSSAYNLTNEIANSIGKLISYLSKSDIKGSKYQS
jgi:four helix bundle protein